MTKILGGATVLGVLAAALLGWLLLGAHEKIGELERDNVTLKSVIQEKENARKSRATTDGAVRRMAPADKLDRLR